MIEQCQDSVVESSASEYYRENYYYLNRIQILGGTGINTTAYFGAIWFD